MFLPLNDKQFEFCRLRRNGLPNINIARLFKISKQAVSRALITMDERIEETLLEMAHANQIEVEKVNSARGILFDHSMPFNASAIIFVSSKHGMQVWYKHEGNCGACNRYTHCIELLWDFADEMKIEEEYMESYGGKYVDKIKGMGFRGFLSVLHLVFAAWLIITALRVLSKVQIFPWYVMDINIISSGILLAVGISSLMIFFNFAKSANVHRILALVNIALLAVFSLYLSMSLISFEFMPSISEFLYSIFDRPYYHYTFGTTSLILFTLILGIPSNVTCSHCHARIAWRVLSLLE